MKNEEIDILLLALLRLLDPEDSKRLQAILEDFRFGVSCGDSAFDRKQVRLRDESIDYLQQIVKTPVEDLL